METQDRKPTRRRRYLGATLVVLILVAAAVALSELETRVTEAQARRIRVGMTRPEVEAILGRPDANDVSQVPDRRDSLAYAPCASYTSTHLLSGTKRIIEVWYNWGSGPPGTDKNGMKPGLHWADPRADQQVIRCRFREERSVDPLLTRLGITPRVRE